MWGLGMEQAMAQHLRLVMRLRPWAKQHTVWCVGAGGLLSMVCSCEDVWPSIQSVRQRC